jgi:hypothetical protein
MGNTPSIFPRRMVTGRSVTVRNVSLALLLRGKRRRSDAIHSCAFTLSVSEPMGEMQPTTISTFKRFLMTQDRQPQEPVTSVEPEVQAEPNVRVEEFKLNGEDLVKKVKELIQEGNTRRLILKNEEGHVLIEIPLTVGVVGGVLGTAVFPVFAAVGAIGAMVARLTLVVEKKE